MGRAAGPVKRPRMSPGPLHWPCRSNRGSPSRRCVVCCRQPPRTSGIHKSSRGQDGSMSRRWCKRSIRRKSRRGATGEHPMVKPVRRALLVSLCVCCSLLLPSAVSWADTLGQPALQMPGATFGGIYRRMLGDNPSTLDPASLTDIYGRAVVSQVFDGLVQFDADLKPMPALAEFWEASRDGRTWTFALRRGVTFHHGREVTAHDVVYSFTRLLNPQKPVPVTELFRF